MHRALFFIFFLLFGLWAKAQESTGSSSLSLSRPHGSWNAGVSALRFQDELGAQKVQTSFGISLSLTHDLTSFLNLRLNPSLRFQNGNVQSDSATSTKGKESTLSVSEASAHLHSDEWIELSLGALNGARSFSPLLVDSNLAFPAARLTLQAGARENSFAAVFAEAAVPTSSTLTSNSRDFEKTPSFTAAGLHGQWKASAFQVSPRASYFEYKDLPSQVARDSGLLGNTLKPHQNLGPASEFLYEYRGWDSSLELRFSATRLLDFALSGSFVRNTAAPGGLNQGARGKASMDLWIGPLKWTPTFEYYRIEPDATVAYYMDTQAYETNRVGYWGGLAVQYRELFQVGLKGGESAVIFESAAQARERFVFFNLETLDAVF